MSNEVIDYQTVRHALVAMVYAWSAQLDRQGRDEAFIELVRAANTADDAGVPEARRLIEDMAVAVKHAGMPGDGRP